MLAGVPVAHITAMTAMTARNPMQPMRPVMAPWRTENPSSWLVSWAPAIGAPHDGQVVAVSETFLPHSAHLTIAMP